MPSSPLKSLDTNILPNPQIVWSKCCICQKTTNEKLICPILNPIKNIAGAGYKSFVENLSEFQKIGALPSQMQIETIFKFGNDAENTLMENRARWHKSCCLQFNRNELERVKKRKLAKHSTSASSCDDSSFNSSFSSPEGKKPKSSSTSLSSVSDDACFICKETAGRRAPLRRVKSLQVEKLKICSSLTDNEELKSFLEINDLDEQELMYHTKCYTKFTNCLRKSNDKAEEEGKSAVCESMAFASVAQYITDHFENCENNCNKVMLKMSTLCDLYSKTLADYLGLQNSDGLITHSTRLRERILEHFPELQAQLSGKEYYILRNRSAIFRDSYNLDDDAVCTKRLLKQVRQDISEASQQFAGTFRREECVPPSLLALVNYLLYGNDEVENMQTATHPGKTISELIFFNYHERFRPRRVRNDATVPIRHSKRREPNIPVYIGLSLYGKTRNNQLIETMHELGLSISSTRVREITASFGHMTVERAKEEGVVCPANLKHNLFTVSAYDNIDHNFSSTSSESSFHGTAISIFQLPGIQNSDEGERHFNPNVSIFTRNDKKVPMLPDSYAVVKEISLPNKEPNAPTAEKEICDRLSNCKLGDEWKLEKSWLDHSRTERIDGDLDISWSAFHASKENPPSKTSRVSLLPLFYESSTSPSMLKHAMDQVRNITEFLNPGQIPVMCLDQPLFALGKTIQWNWPQAYGESKFVLLFAPFHIEQAFLKVIGQILTDSGWLEIVANSGVKTEAGADSCLKVHHVTKARAIHQKTAAVLYSLLHDAFDKDESALSFEEWIKDKESKCPTFKFWLLVLNLEILLLSLVRSLRTGDYALYLQVLKRALPWFFFTDHVHYARWLSVHVKDLEELPNKASSVHEKFCNGQFVVCKTRNRFSALAIDQAHEQNNALIKGDGGAIGLLQDPSMLNRWMLAGPHISTILQEYEDEHSSSKGSGNCNHHEQYAAHQKKHQNEKHALRESFLEFGNPFEETSSELVMWNSKIVMENERCVILMNAEEKAFELYTNFVKSRIQKNDQTNLFAPLPKNNIKIFAPDRKKNVIGAISTLKSDLELFSRAFIVSKNRNLDISKFFEHENATAPPSLSTNGNLRACQKADLLKILEKTVSIKTYEEAFDTIIYDGAALIHSVLPRNSKTFGSYCGNEFQNRLIRDAEKFHVKRIHLAWDLYHSRSLKNSLREKRGVGVRRRVAKENPLPKNWNDFLLNDDNKSEFFSLLGRYAIDEIKFAPIISDVNGFVSASNSDATLLQGCVCRKEEEADGRIFLHAFDSAVHGAKKLIIMSVDTDVAVLAISFFHHLQNAGLSELWMLFGSGKHQRLLNIGAISQELGEEKSVALRGFHAFTGSDVTSSFSTKGKASAWNTWESFPEVTEAFKFLSFPFSLSSMPTHILKLLENFVIHLYYSGGDQTSVNKVRQILFTAMSRNIKNLPPTHGALQQHALRAAYQAGQVWGRACSKNESIPEPEGWGWKMENGKWTPVWSNLPSIWDGCRELVRCGCKTGCQKNCSCSKNKLPCTLLCTNCSRRGCENLYNDNRSDVMDENLGENFT